MPGSGDLPPRNAADIAWSEYNHHWSGLFVLAIGVLSLLNAAGLRWARHWPLLFLGLAAFLFLRSDPEVWPLGEIGFFASFRDVEVLQHRVFVVLIAAFAIFEWRVRTGRAVKPWARLVFPLLCAGGGMLLLTHSHAIANVKDQLLIELTHTPLALCRHRRRMGALAGTAARSGNQPGRLAHRAMAVAAVLRPGRPDAAELSRGVALRPEPASAAWRPP